MFRGRMFRGGKLAVTLAFTGMVALATGVSCRGFFVKPTLTSVAVGPANPTIQTGTTNNTVQMFAVATFDDFETGPIQAKRALWHQQCAGLHRLFVHAAAGSEARTAVEIDAHMELASGVGRNAPVGGQPGFT